MTRLTGALLFMPALALILGAVTGFTLLAAWTFQRPALRAWFCRPGLGTARP
jgi:hypothetical protein